MLVGVGFSEAQDTEAAGAGAAKEALAMAGRSDPCDMALLFATSWHDPHDLRLAVTSVLGGSAAVIGGGAVGAITNTAYGYAGEQVGLAAIWLDEVGVELFAEGGLADREEKVGVSLGKRMGARGVDNNTPTLLLYDGINSNHDGVRLNLATPLLKGIEKGLGFLPKGLVGAGLQGDFEATPTMQWTGSDIAAHHAMMLAFNGDVRLDSVIMHGCRPSGGYYEVTKAENQTILEVNGQPALPFIQSQLHPSLPAEAFPFFIIFGINRDPGGKYNEKNYANRLCLAVDEQRGGIVMFESDMAAGTKFQIMHRSLNLDYLPPRIDHIFTRIGERKPVFAFYIDCAGRAGRFGSELEDAVVVQKAVGKRAPLLGIYSGVEIAPIMEIPRTLDWTGVFCLFSTGR